MNLEQKLIELRRLLPYIKKEKQSQYIKYKSYKLDDIWQVIQLKMNELGINTRVVDEQNGKYTTYERTTQKGTELMFLYESDLTILWVNAEEPSENFVKTIHVIGSNNDPAKAKGASYTYAFKYDLSYQFSIPMGEIDPDLFDTSQQHKLEKAEEKKNRVPMITPAQLKKLFATNDQMKWEETGTDRKEFMLKNYKTTSSKGLTKEQAGDFINKMEIMIIEQQGGTNGE